MSIKYSGENVLTFLLGLLNNKFNTKVDKVTGKGLSTNDLTETLKGNYDTAYTHSQSSHAPANSERNTIVGVQKNGADITIDTSTRKVNITVPTKTSDLSNDSEFITSSDIPDATTSAKGVVILDTSTNSTSTTKSATPSAVKAAYDLANTANNRTIPALSTSIDIDATSDSKSVTPKAVKTYVDGKMSSTYKPAGSVTFTDLPALSATVLGNVYNVTNAFNTTADFIEGAGKSHPAGTNVVVVYINSTYKFDVLAGFVDLSGYTPTEDFVEYTNSEVQNLWDSVFTS